MKASLRERNKTAKESIIRQTARRLFLKHGYEKTTLREIAKEADVGFGTVSAYSNDKSGLLAMIFVEELKKLDPLFADIPDKGDLLDQLVLGLGKLFAFWSAVPSLSAHVLQQMEFFHRNPHMDLIMARRKQARRELAAFLSKKKEAGKIRSDVDIDRAADTLFAIYTSSVREWSITMPHDQKKGIARLRSLLELSVRGLQR